MSSAFKLQKTKLISHSVLPRQQHFEGQLEEQQNRNTDTDLPGSCSYSGRQGNSPDDTTLMEMKNVQWFVCLIMTYLCETNIGVLFPGFGSVV